MYRAVDLFYQLANLCCSLPVLPFGSRPNKNPPERVLRADQTLTLLQYGWRAHWHNVYRRLVTCSAFCFSSRRNLANVLRRSVSTLGV